MNFFVFEQNLKFSGYRMDCLLASKNTFLNKISLSLKTRNYSSVSLVLIIITDIIICSAIMYFRSYTEIDWIAYMQEVEGFLNGTLDYSDLKGQTGPCVYPAGFLYFYSVLYYLTDEGNKILLAQKFFIFFYAINLGLVLNIYRLTQKVPFYAMIFMCFTSYRVHSIFILRLFNDSIAILFIFICLNAYLYKRYTCSAIFFSIALSIKMNILLFLPGYLLGSLFHTGIMSMFCSTCQILVVQIFLGAPFLLHNSHSYFNSAFNFARQFEYKWTVNWRLIDEQIFLDRRFHFLLLFLLSAILLIFLINFVIRLNFKKNLKFYKSTESNHNIIYLTFVTNFIGITFSRSLHYQFYVWYYYTIPFLLWNISYQSNCIKLLLWGLIELCWNTYPSTVMSSSILHICHLIITTGLLFNIKTAIGIN